MNAQAKIHRATAESSHTHQPTQKNLRMKRRAMPVHRLPFVGNDFGKAKDGVEQCGFWDLPMRDGYSANADLGRTIGAMYLKHVRESNEPEFETPLLGWMMLSMLDKRPETQVEKDALRGQIVGFAEQLSRWLIDAARYAGAPLDSITMAVLLTKANDALSTQPGA